MKQTDASLTDTPVLTDTPMQLAVERRLLLLLGKRPGPPISLAIQGVPTSQTRGIMLGYIGANIALLNSGRLTINELRQDGEGSGSLSDTRTGRTIERSRRLLLRLVIQGIRARGEA